MTVLGPTPRFLRIGAALAFASCAAGAASGAALALVLPRRSSGAPVAEAQTSGPEPEGFDTSADTETGSWAQTERALPNSLVAAEYAAEELARRTHAPGSQPEELDREDGILAEMTRAHLAPEDRMAFYIAMEANRRTESGEAVAPRFSTLRTTAGAEHRASFGPAQLNAHELLGNAARLPDDALARLEVTRDELNRMTRSGDAVMAWYRVLVERLPAEDAGAASIFAADLERIKTIDLERDRASLVATMGPRFAEATGLPREAILELADTAVLRTHERREAFASLYVARNQARFDPAHRDGARMADTARALARTTPDLDRILVRLGGVEDGAASLGHYLGVGDVAENRFGWYARAAAAAVPRDRYRAIVAAVEPAASRIRELYNFENAASAISEVRDLAGAERMRMLARIGRCFHGAPGRARTAFFEHEDTSKPKARTAADVEALVLEYRLTRTWSDQRVQQQFDALLLERGYR
jgi:hypothetical protein